jgi:cytochrome c oxidase subunit 1
VYLLGGLIFTLAFLDAGRMSVPRRYAEHLLQWMPYDRVGSIGAVLIILGMLYFAARIIIGLSRAAAAGSAPMSGVGVPVEAGAAHSTG